MAYLVWLFRLALFLLLFVFAVNNSAEVKLFGLWGQALSSPLIVILLATFALGFAAGLLAMYFPYQALRKQVQANKAKQKHAASPAPSFERIEPAEPLDAVL